MSFSVLLLLFSSSWKWSPPITLPQIGGSQHLRGPGCHESIVIRATLEGFGKTLPELGSSEKQTVCDCVGTHEQNSAPWLWPEARTRRS